MNQITFKLETLTCPSCVNKIEKTLKQTSGVHEVNVLFNASKVKVQYDENIISSDQIASTINKIGFHILG